jgi:MFS family permease
VFGPLLGGVVIRYLGWRWNNWISLIFGASGVLLALLMHETYAPALLRRKAAHLRASTGQSHWWSRYDHQAGLADVMKVNLLRPLVMSCVEPIW